MTLLSMVLIKHVKHVESSRERLVVRQAHDVYYANPENKFETIRSIARVLFITTTSCGVNTTCTCWLRLTIRQANDRQRPHQDTTTGLTTCVYTHRHLLCASQP